MTRVYEKLAETLAEMYWSASMQKNASLWPMATREIMAKGRDENLRAGVVRNPPAIAEEEAIR